MKNLLIIALVSFSFNLMGQAPWENGNLMVSENGRYLQY